MLTPPARAPRGDPDMTRRLADRAHVRRQGQTRCYVGQLHSTEQATVPAPAHTSQVLSSLYSLSRPHVSEPAREDPHTAASWSSTARLPDPHLSFPLSPENSGHCSSSNSISQSKISQIKSPPSELLSCSWRLPQLLPQHRLQSEHCAVWQEEDRYTATHSQFAPHKPHETRRTTVFEEKRYQRSHSEIQVPRPCHEQSWTVVIRQGRRFIPTSLIVLCFLLLLPRSLVAKPASASEREGPGHLILNTPLCKPVSNEDLQRMMGPYFDSSKMAADMPSDYSYHSDHSSASGFQGDDPRASHAQRSDDLVQEEILSTLDQESSWADDDDEEDEEMGDERVWVKEKEVVESIYNDEEGMEETLEEEEKTIDEPRPLWRASRPEPPEKASGKYKHKHRQHRADLDDSREDYPSRQRVFMDSYAYMRRRRRKRSPQVRSRSRRRDVLSKRGEFVNSKYNKSSDSSNDNNDNWASNAKANGAKRNGRTVSSYNRRQLKDTKNRGDDQSVKDEDADKPSDIGALPLKIAVSRKDKKLRKSLKKKFRQNAKYLLKRRPPWECRMTSKTLIMKQGIFPRVLVDGNCGVDRKCFYRLYDCKPQRYNIRLMQRDPNHCNPLPKVGNITVFEERWNLITKQITVGCNCVNAQKFKNRRRSRRRTNR